MSEIRYPTPEEWVAYLREPGRKKAVTQFAQGDGRCCLGHYLDMCGVKYPRQQGTFSNTQLVDAATLPEGHWLLEHDSVLADINDGNLGFGEVIEYIEDNLVGKV